MVSCCKAQYPQDFFASPLDIPLTLSGNYGEIRPNHFHFGVDFRTMNKEGLPVKASANGYVSRIKVSLVGYGKAIYITHPNGYTTVYAHLKEFSGEFQKYVERKQIEAETFEIELYPDSNQLPVQKGQLIGLSGNTGSSQGPHLHYEIRKTNTEVPLNPQLFGLKVADVVNPFIKSIAFYGLDGKVNNSTFLLKTVQPSTTRFTDTILVSGTFGVGIETYDKESAKGSTNGVYDIQLFIDDTLYFQLKLDSFSFDHSRYVNAVIDHDLYRTKRIKVQKLFLSQNNLLTAYPVAKNRGKITFNDENTHKIKLVSKDIKGQSSSINFHIKSIRSSSFKKTIVPSADYVKTCYTDRSNFYHTPDISINIPAQALYDSLYFEFSKRDNSTDKRFITPAYNIHNEKIPLQKAIILSFKIKDRPELDTTKLVAVRLKGDSFISSGGEYVKGNLICETKTFGSYTVMIDTTAPTIRSLLKNKSQSVKALKKVTYSLKDNLSGLKSYKTYVNEKFVVAELDGSSGILSLDVKKAGFKPGNNSVVIKAFDERGNMREYTHNIIY